MYSEEFTQAELGRDQGHNPPADKAGLPRNGTFAVPHVATSASRLNVLARAYSQRYDEATTYNRDNAAKMLLDPVISGCLEILADTVALLTWSVKPEDPENQAEVDAAARCDKYLKRIPRFVDHARWLVYNGRWAGRSACQVRRGWTEEATPRLVPKELVNVNGDKLAFRWDGRVGISIRTATDLGNHHQTQWLDSTPVYFLNDEERDGIVVHRCFSEDADFFSPTQAGSIHGIGLRHYLYWVWVLKSDIYKMSLDFLQWFAKGLMVFFFESGNDEHRKEVQDWIEKQDGSGTMMFPRFRDRQTGVYAPAVERFDVSTANPQFLQNLITMLDEVIRFRILHQSGTTQAISGALGSGTAQAHETTFDAVVKINALLLAESFTQDLVGPYYRDNEPGVPCGKFVYNIDTPNAQGMIDAAEAIVNIGGSVAQEPIAEAAGIPAPTKGQTILGGPAPSQPAAVGAVPDGTPMVGAGESGEQPVQ